MDKVLEKNAFYKGLVMQSSAATVAILARVIASTLFITQYPLNWLPLFYICQALISFLVILPTLILFINNDKKAFILLQTALIFAAAALFAISKLDWFGAVLVTSLGLLAMNDLFGLITWHCINEAFSFRNFKTISATILKISILAACSINLILANMSHKIGISGLFYFLIVSMILATGVNMSQRKLQKPKRKISKSNPLYKQPLYIQLFIYTFLLLASYTVADFTLKYALASSLNKLQIASFQLYYFSLTGIIGISLLILCRKFSDHISIFVLLAALPLYYFVATLILVYHYNLWTATFFVAGHGILFNSLTTMARELIYNVLPADIAGAGRLLINAVAMPGGMIAGIMLMWLLANQSNFQVPVLFITIIMIFLIFYLYRATANYIKTLKESISLNRFDLLNAQAPLNNKFYYKYIIKAISASSSSHMIIFCLDVLKQFPLKSVPEEAIRHLGSEACGIKLAVIELIVHFKDLKHLPALSNLLIKEENPVVIKQILYSLAKLGDKTICHQAANYLAYPDVGVNIAAMNLMLLCKTEKEQSDIFEHLIKLSKSPDQNTRKEIAYLLGQQSHKEMLGAFINLINDINSEIRTIAILSSEKSKHTELIPSLMNSLNYPKTSSYTVQALLSYDTIILEQIEPFLQRADAIGKINLIKTIAKMNHENAEHYFIKLMSTSQIFILTELAKEAAERACLYGISKVLKEIIHNRILIECDIIKQLFSLSKTDIAAGFKTEVIARKQLAKQRLLYWIVTNSANPLDVLETIPFISDFSHIKPSQDYIDRAVEVIRHYTKNESLIMEALLENFNSVININFDTIQDDWLKMNAAYYTTTPSQERSPDMMLMEIIFTLRKTYLFASLPGEILHTIAERVAIIEFKQGDIIFKQDDIGDKLYIIHDGEVNIIHNNQTFTLSAGALFGELALIDNKPRDGSAIAACDISLLTIDKHTFEDVTYSFPKILWELTNHILRYLRANSKRTPCPD